MTVICRMAFDWLNALISRMPVAVRSGVSPSLSASASIARPGGVDVERDLAAEQVRRDAAEEDVRVGDGDLGAAPAVAERAGVGARASAGRP